MAHAAAFTRRQVAVAAPAAHSVGLKGRLGAALRPEHVPCTRRRRPHRQPM